MKYLIIILLLMALLAYVYLSNTSLTVQHQPKPQSMLFRKPSLNRPDHHPITQKHQSVLKKFSEYTPTPTLTPTVNLKPLFKAVINPFNTYGPADFNVDRTDRLRPTNYNPFNWNDPYSLPLPLPVSLSLPLPKTVSAYTPKPKTTIKLSSIFRVPDNTQVAVPANNDPYNDRHNTHDHAVVNDVTKSYNRLAKNTDLSRSKTDTVHDIRKYINNNLSGTKRKNALMALDSIQSNSIPVSSIGETETKALQVVWNRINNKYDGDTQKVLKENLADEMVDMINTHTGKPKCVSGRLSRIVGTLDGTDENVQIKPTFILNKEMMNKAPLIRDKIVAETDKDLLERYNNGEDGQDITDLDNKIKAGIRSELRKDYVDSGAMTDVGFDKEIGQWIDNI